MGGMPPQESPRASNVFRELATCLEALETRGVVEDVTPRADSFLSESTCPVDVSVRIPLVPEELAGSFDVTGPSGLEIGDDGRATLTLTFQFSGSADAATDGEHLERSRTGSDDGEQELGIEEVSTNGRASAGDDGDTDVGAPAYRDPEQLEVVYETYETFAEMTDALDVDVTPQTVRRHMIEHGIHEPSPRSFSGGGTARTGRTTGSDPTGTESEETENAGPDADSPETTGGALDSAASDSVEDASQDDPDTTEEQSLGDYGAVEHPALPRDVPLEELREALQESRTVHEFRRHLDIDPAPARELLEELGVLDLVVGRISAADGYEITIEELSDRIQSHPTES